MENVLQYFVLKCVLKIASSLFCKNCKIQTRQYVFKFLALGGAIGLQIYAEQLLRTLCPLNTFSEEVEKKTFNMKNS